MRHFDVSIDGFWRSFRVAVVLTPTLLVDVAVDTRLAEEIGAGGDGLLARLLTYAAGFIVFPLVLAVIGRPLGLERNYVP
ncbi:hypothetical protein J8J27_32425, partial [Mycobacterium tuberculosis]|nr:hypothetical protein [Mycobacterium tuberculosis]